MKVLTVEADSGHYKLIVDCTKEQLNISAFLIKITYDFEEKTTNHYYFLVLQVYTYNVIIYKTQD